MGLSYYFYPHTTQKDRMPLKKSFQRFGRSRSWAFARFLYDRFNEVNVPQVSSSLTFTTLLALVPLITVMLVVVSAFPMFADVSAQFNQLITQTLMPAGADAVSEYLFQFRDQASKLTAIGIIMMMVTSLMLIQTIERTFNQIWRVNSTRNVLTRFLVYWALLSLGPLVLGIGMSAWGVVWARTSFYLNYPLLANTVQLLVSLVGSAAALWLLYKLVPARFVPARHALIGAVFAAVGLELLRSGFAFYVGNFNSYQLVYGTFAAIPIFLLWLNLMWMVILTGAVLTASLSYWEGDAFRREFGNGGRFDDVLKVLLLLSQAQDKGQSIKIQEFRSHINMGYDELGDLLEKLALKGYITQSRHGNWLLKTAPEHIRVGELFSLFVYRSSDNEKDDVGRAVQQVMEPALAATDMTLAEFICRAESAPDVDLPVFVAEGDKK
ncbi:YihY family protein [Neisseria shayeganii 871]|uniref:UPF0761 membrane protein HMPREF9371_0560 n=2 Tax=Neisseria shayeganii TaxID=607712 RepID=G4CG21_9NEIS|nr:YihY family protein [Neisseria shayeganii 871]